MSRTLRDGVSMIFTVKSKSDMKGRKLYFLDANNYGAKLRNKIRDFTGCYGREQEPGEWKFAVGMLVLLFTFIGGCIANNLYVVASAGLTLVAVLVGGVAVGVFMNTRKKRVPDLPFVPMDDVRWSYLMVAFADNRELWQRMIDCVTVGEYWGIRYETDLQRDIEAVVTDYMSYTDPSNLSGALRAEVERIFAEYDQKQEDAKVLREIEDAEKAVSDQAVFEQNVQMAREDISFHQSVSMLS